jgi:membrane protease YdiL (CAAX protease family)
VGDDTHVARLMLTAGLSVAAVGGLVAGLLYIAVRRPGRQRLPARRPKAPAWNGLAVLAAFGLFLVFGWLANGIQSILTSAGFFRVIYGPDFPVELPANPNPEQKAAATIRYLWATAFAFPLQLVAIWLLPRALKVANPFHTRGWQRAAIAGYLTWLIITPAAFCVFVLASIAHLALTGQEPEKHPLTALGEQAGNLEWGLFVLQTVLIAPVIEEWLFRGVLLPWLAQKRPVPPETPFTIQPAGRPILVLCLALAVGMIFTFGSAWVGRPDEVRRAFANDTLGAVAAYMIPAVFFVALIPFDFILPRLSRLRRHLRIRSPQQVRAIWASAALFAAVHAHVWPSPVPLVVLAVGLGYLYLRTRSLVGPIVVHGMFNAVSAVYLLLGGPS